jgi:hypothetical protein
MVSAADTTAGVGYSTFLMLWSMGAHSISAFLTVYDVNAYNL